MSSLALEVTAPPALGVLAALAVLHHLEGPCAPPMVVEAEAAVEPPPPEHTVDAEVMEAPAAEAEEEIKAGPAETEGPTEVAAVVATGPTKAETAETEGPTAAEAAAEMAAEPSPSAAAVVYMAEMAADEGQPVRTENPFLGILLNYTHLSFRIVLSKAPAALVPAPAAPAVVASAAPAAPPLTPPVEEAAMAETVAAAVVMTKVAEEEATTAETAETETVIAEEAVAASSPKADRAIQTENRRAAVAVGPVPPTIQEDTAETARALSSTRKRVHLHDL